MDAARPVEVPRPQLVEAGLFLLLVAVPLAVTPFSSSPFGDGKLVLLVAGTLCLWASGLPVDRRVAALGGLWFLVTVVAALVGVDPAESLLAQTNSSGGGALFVGCLVVLAAIGAAMPPGSQERARLFLVGGGLAVAAVAIAFRLTPDTFEPLFPERALRGATLGNPVFAAAFCAAALAAASAFTSPRRRLIVSGVVALGCASVDQRSALVLPLVALVAILIAERKPWRSQAPLIAVVVGALALYLAVEPVLPRLGSGSLQQLGVASSERARLAVWRGSFVGALERPALGWGPANTRTAVARGATAAEREEWGRSWGDAHNLGIETLTTTGAVGLLSLGLLLAVLIGRAWRRGPPVWAMAAAVTLGFFALYEPLNVVTTPLLFLMLGIAAARAPGRVLGAMGSLRVGVSVLLVLGLLASGVALASATLERWGTRYGEVWALRSALDLQPWRLSAQRNLALRLSIDGGAGDREAATEARELIDEAVAGHPWDPQVRLWAADVEHLMRNDDAALAWVRRHAARFPADAALIEQVRRGLSEGFADLGAEEATAAG